jgi:TRAP-type C4-dicarboxylate transport system substrate-binding protein
MLKVKKLTDVLKERMLEALWEYGVDEKEMHIDTNKYSIDTFLEYEIEGYSIKEDAEKIFERWIKNMEDAGYEWSHTEQDWV